MDKYDFPTYVDLEFTARCNLNCGFCFGPTDYRNENDQSSEFWRSTIKEIYERGSKGIVISGGEPTLYKPLPHLLEYAKELGLITVVSTHGRHKKKVLEIAKVCDWIALPVDAQSLVAINMLRGDSWGLKQALQIGLDLLTINPTLKLKLGTVVTKLNMVEIENLGHELLATKDNPFSTWKLYQYTPRRKHKHKKDLYMVDDNTFKLFEKNLKKTWNSRRMNIVFSSINSRRKAYVFVYPSGEVAIPNIGNNFGDISLGNILTDGYSVFDKFKNQELANNEKNFSSTYSSPS